MRRGTSPAPSVVRFAPLPVAAECLAASRRHRRPPRRRRDGAGHESNAPVGQRDVDAAGVVAAAPVAVGIRIQWPDLENRPDARGLATVTGGDDRTPIRPVVVVIVVTATGANVSLLQLLGEEDRVRRPVLDARREAGQPDAAPIIVVAEDLAILAVTGSP